MVLVEPDAELGEIGAVLFFHVGNQLFRRNAFLVGAQHDRRAMSIVGANIKAFVAALLLKTHPDVGLDVFDEMAEVNRAVGIRQGAGN